MNARRWIKKKWQSRAPLRYYLFGPRPLTEQDRNRIRDLLDS